MRYIIRKETNPYFNIAAEEYVLKAFKEDCFMLWRNQPSVIVGKHQNTLAEINLDYINAHKIPVVRRISGGGTVFHDLGNLNFTFIKNGKRSELVDFRKYTQPIIDVLDTLGIDAVFEGRNDLTIKGKKFSGNAEHVHESRVLHHGTLLFSSQLNDLSKALKVDESKFNDKAVKSVRSRVTNISEHLVNELSIEDFEKTIYEYVQQTDKEAEFYEFSDEDIARINALVESKYNTWEWNFAYSPKYNFFKSYRSKGGIIEYNIDVKDGLIKHIHFTGDFFSTKGTEVIEKALVGSEHSKEGLTKTLATFKIEEHFKNVELSEFINGMF
jgi:lipoate-protein ligase A